jgi:3-hydroxyacyl-[acyl-carrier-protein] dehydratase
MQSPLKTLGEALLRVAAAGLLGAERSYILWSFESFVRWAICRAKARETFRRAIRFFRRMRFCLLDRIVELEPGVRVKGVKRLRPDEDYLKDHFPRFPVMPGVLMLEAMYQASAWLVRQSEGFAHSVVVLKEARNIKYNDFVTPGKELEVTAEILKQDDSLTTLKAQGTIDGNMAVSGRLVLERFNLADRYPSRANTDPYLRSELREVLHRLLPAAP